MDSFWRTVMGQRFIEGTAPSLVKQLERLNTNLERIATQLEKSAAGSDSQPMPAHPKLGS